MYKFICQGLKNPSVLIEISSKNLALVTVGISSFHHTYVDIGWLVDGKLPHLNTSVCSFIHSMYKVNNWEVMSTDMFPSPKLCDMRFEGFVVVKILNLFIQIMKHQVYILLRVGCM